MHLPQETLAFLARFAKSTEGRLFKQVLEGRLAEVDKTLRVLKAESLFHAQGRAQELESLIKLIDDAPANFNRNQSARSQGTRQDASN